MRHRVVFGILFATAAPAALFAQWPAYPSPGVPRMADGKPNLTAPAPKTPDGKPDLTGIWEVFRPLASALRSGAPARTPSAARTAATNDDFIAAARRSPFWNIGSAFPDGLPFQPWA